MNTRADSLTCIVQPPGTSTICEGESVTFTADASSSLSGEGPLSYKWFGPNGYTATTQSITVSVAGTYTALVSVIGQEADQTYICSADLVVNTKPTLSVDGATVCKGESAVLTATTDASTILWNTGDTTASITVTPDTTTTYSVTVTSANGCTETKSVTVTVNQPPTASLSDAEICLGDSIVLTVDTSADDVLWSTGETTKSITVAPVTKTTYTVTVTSSEGCTAVAKSTVTVKSCVTNPGTGTPGYWKNHPDAWPVNEIVIGGVVYSKSAAIALMKKSTTKDMTTVMFEQLVAAKLNVLIGNDPSCISSTILAADDWMKAHPVCSKVRADSTAWQEGEPLKDQLDSYNNGLLCAPHRE